MAPTNDLQIAVSNLSTKRLRYDKLWAYYVKSRPEKV